MRRALRLACALGALFPAAALAYRPFDQTDAAVAEAREVELELGPVSLVRASAGEWLAPGFVFNYGLFPRWELVLDGGSVIPLRAAPEERQGWQLETGLLLKGVLREGSLQGQSGPSVALETGVLLPTVPALQGIGASVAAIVSQRWDAATVHLNLELELTRDRRFSFLGGAIVEGPDAWSVRPVGELLVEQEVGSPSAVSGLVGAIWRVGEGLSLDAAVRLAREDVEPVIELRAGLTWAFAL